MPNKSASDLALKCVHCNCCKFLPEHSVKAVMNWRSRLEQSSRAIFYKSFAVFELQPYLDNVNVYKFCNALSKLRMSAHRLEVESGRWVKPNPIPFNERHC